MTLTSYPVKKWEKSKFADPYMREDLNDYGICIDTLETGVTWDRLHKVHREVREFIKSRPRTLCLTHCSHFYAQGTNLYFIFIGKFKDSNEFKTFQRSVIERIEQSGGSLSHHHGVGKMMGNLMEKHLGKEQMAVLKAIKNHFDPNGIMNPGGTLGLDPSLSPALEKEVSQA
jgi:alkyldihydroxyacetonephosphate synthase